MARKRLLSILAGVVAAVGLTIGPAAAQISVPGVGSISLDGGSGVAVNLDTGVDGVLEVDMTIGTSTEEPIQVTGGAKVAGQDVPVGDATRPVTSAVNDAVGGSGGGSATPQQPAPSSPAPGGGGGGGGSSDGPAGGGSTAPGSKVEASGDDARQVRPDPARERQIAALGALRNDLALHGSAPAGSSPVQPGVIGPPSPDGSPSSFQPTIASPQVAPEDEGWAQLGAPAPATEALLATSPIERAAEEVPLLLKLLVGGLVLGSAAVWSTARQELQRSASTPTTA